MCLQSFTMSTSASPISQAPEDAKLWQGACLDCKAKARSAKFNARRGGFRVPGQPDDVRRCPACQRQANRATVDSTVPTLCPATPVSTHTPRLSKARREQADKLLGELNVGPTAGTRGMGTPAVITPKEHKRRQFAALFPAVAAPPEEVTGWNTQFLLSFFAAFTCDQLNSACSIMATSNPNHFLRVHAKSPYALPVEGIACGGAVKLIGFSQSAPRDFHWLCSTCHRCFTLSPQPSARCVAPELLSARGPGYQQTMMAQVLSVAINGTFLSCGYPDVSCHM